MPMVRAVLVLVALCASARADVCTIDPPRADVHVTVDGLRATIAIDGLGTRTVEGATCDELADAVALVVAMAGDAPAPAVEARADDPREPRDPGVPTPLARPGEVVRAVSVGVARGAISELVIGASRSRDAHGVGLELAVAAPDSVTGGG